MGVFPFIPVVAYTLIISAFSYISARILKHFNFSSDLLAFLRRKGRLAPLPITHSHELLPTSTASRPATPLFGMYAASSNVTHSTSFDALPVLPPRLISPASSPPGRSQSRRVIETPLPSFSILKPTLYRQKQRRSRSLGVPTHRPQYWASRFPPSPPVQQEIIDGRRRNSEEDIPLVFLSRRTEDPSHECMLAPAAVLHEPPMSAPVLFMPESSPHSSTHGPLVDISPLSPESTSSSSRQASSIAGPSYSSSGSSLQFSPSSDSNSPSSLSRSTQSSDIGVQSIGGVGGFAYDWGFDRINLVKSPPRTVALHESSSMPLSRDTIVDIVTFRGRIEDCLPGVDSLVGRDTGVAEGALYTTTESALVQVPASVQWDLPPVDSVDGCTSADPEHSTSVPSTSEGTGLITPLVSGLVVSNDSQVDDPQAIVLKPLEDNRATHEGGVILEKPDEDFQDDAGISILPPLPLFIVENSDLQERPLIAVDTSDLIRSSKRCDSLSARGESHSSPMSPSQIPTPPASPPLTSQASKILSGIGNYQLRVSIVSPMSEPASPMEDIAAIEEPLAPSATGPQTSSAVCQEDVQEENSDSVPAVVLPETPRCDETDDLASPASSDASPTRSPGSTLPAWSERAADAQPLGISAARAALVQEEVAWPKTFNVEAGNEGAQKMMVDEEMTPITTTKQHVQPAAVPGEGQETLPGTSPMSESTTKKQSASSTAVVTVSGASRRRWMRGLPIDVALAMQMRPGLGVGADPAWMVRFLMAMFGWFAIMIAGRGGEVDVYAL